MELFENTKIESPGLLSVDAISLTESDANLMPDNTLYESFKEKIINLQKMIEKSIVATQRYKTLDIYGSNELTICIHELHSIFFSLEKLLEPMIENKPINELYYINKLQDITNVLSISFRTFGTESFDDLITVCFGKQFVSNNFTTDAVLDKYEIIKNFVHPIGYKIIHWKNEQKKTSVSNETVLKKNRIVEDFMIVEDAVDLDCFDLARTCKTFQTKVYGIKVAIQNPEERKTLIVCGIMDDITLSCLNYKYTQERIKDVRDSKPNEPDFLSPCFERFIQCLTLKEIIIYNNSELHNRYVGYINQIFLIKQKPMSQIIKEFIGSELYNQRTTLIQLLLKSDEQEFQYLSYLLYDLLSNDVNGNIDTQEQTLLFDSLPWNVKKYFRDAMKETLVYTNNLSSFDDSKIPFEQQICLMKADESVKEKAMVKLKEVKSKSEDTGSKARHFLEGLLKIPFNIYKVEPILKKMEECVCSFNETIKSIHSSRLPITEFPIKSTYTSIEMRKYISILKNEYHSKYNTSQLENIKTILTKGKRNELIANICYLNNIIKNHQLKHSKLCHSGKKTDFMITQINDFIHFAKGHLPIMSDIESHLDLNNPDVNYLIMVNLTEIEIKLEYIYKFIESINDTLDTAVHGHKKAKRQIERIVGQWINGEKTGYCFGFEGPPGVGKTSLAKKGIAKCLLDENGVSRPFAFIAIGGSSNGSTLDGHNYTYVGSTWGRIVDILIEHKCMNPIIFIDELDKVSKTEHGREIIGILTHLIDPTQNDEFQDKYFNGIDLDLSKALFIFSYNDASSIDRILLDRIHRVKFSHLSFDEKLVITRKYIFPEIFKKMGLEQIIEMDDEVIGFIIEHYTCEPGVRKLKELLFEIIGEINLEILYNTEHTEYTLPIHVTKEDVKTKYLKERHEMKPYLIHSKPESGLINGLWANEYGKGGVLPIETTLFPCGTFLEMKLTGMQGDVMKESMSVAKSLAWQLLTEDEQKALAESMDKTKLQGIHVHTPDGAVPKDGPSAGTAITIAMYSLLSKRKIKNDVAITGEMCLQGKVTAIGGLDLKIAGGIRAGVKQFLFPKANMKDFDDFMEKYKDKPLLDGIEFHPVETIEEVFKLVFI